MNKQQPRSLVETLQVLKDHLEEKSEPGYRWPPMCCAEAIKLAEQQGTLLAEALDSLKRVACAAGTAAHYLATSAPVEASRFRADESLCREILAKARKGEPEPPGEKRIPLEAAVRILEKAEAVVFDSGGHIVTFPGFADLSGEDDNEFLCLAWVEEGAEYMVRFTEGCNRQAALSGESLFFIDSEGDEIQITPLFGRELAR